MTLQRGQVLKRIDAFQFARVDQTHEEIADVCAVGRLEEEGVFSVENGLLQGALTQTVVQGRARLPEKEGQWGPVREAIPEGLAQAGVGFDEVIRELGGHPRVEVVEDRAAVRLVIHEACLRRQAALACLRVVAIDGAERLEDAATLRGETRDYLDDVPPGMGRQ